MKNFDFLKEIPALSRLYSFCNAAEEGLYSDPVTSAINSRRALENLVEVTAYLKDIVFARRANLLAKLKDEDFVDFIDDEGTLSAMHYVRMAGNVAVHQNRATKAEALLSLENIYNAVGFVFSKIGVIASYPNFDKNLIPQVRPAAINTDSTTAISSGERETPIVHTPAVTVLPHTSSISETETRKLYIDMMLREAGWDVLDEKNEIQPLKAGIEIELPGMPNASGVGYADYVLFGANGLPLAVIEAKKTAVDPNVGKQQAILYADLLERKYGRRPVIYYTNGLTTYIIDGLGYPYRKIFAFHTADDLERLIQKRSRGRINDVTVKNEITNREYQKRSIKAVCESFNNNKRKAILVMATGTGKTRVAISLSEVLMRNRWIKNVLFLADRTALVNQAKKNFVKFLPGETVTAISDNSDTRSLDSRITLSTYQTMINFVDTEHRDFSVGRFDLIFVDEAHRSIFGKYRAIFSYFDSLVVGLTATPRDEIARNTYEFFEVESGEPTSHYEYEEAVADGFLVPYVPIKRGTYILENGIKYKDLSEEEKEQLEKVFDYEAEESGSEDPERNIEGSEIFRYIFNIDTVDKVLQDLMENGQKVSGGEKIGKTIIFAYNHKHAQLIVDRFNELYAGTYGTDFCTLIDNTVNYGQTLIDNFGERARFPQIAVSVDMLDTGVDVPDILNLVFFKIVKSKIKFEQMLGRGTRKSEDIFGPRMDKQKFYVFDWCRNFEFFDINPNGEAERPSKSLTESLFDLRADLAYGLQAYEYQSDEFSKTLHDEIKATLYRQVSSLSDTFISVREKWDTVSKFKNKDNWQALSILDVYSLKHDISPLVARSVNDEYAQRFDALNLMIELSLVDPQVRSSWQQSKLITIARDLRDLASIPQVLERMDVINEVLSPRFLEDLTLDRVERVRIQLRDLVKYLAGNRRKTFTIDIEDTVTEGGEIEDTFRMSHTYGERVMDYLMANINSPVLRKIQNLEKITGEDISELQRILWEELGSREEYDAFVGHRECGNHVAVFIRSMIGIDRKVAMEKFSSFLDETTTLTAEQEEYLKDIITYVCQNGDITGEIITNRAPFSEYNWAEVYGSKMQYIGQFVRIIHQAIAA